MAQRAQADKTTRPVEILPAEDEAPPRSGSILDLPRRVEAILMTSDRPVNAGRLIEALDIRPSEEPDAPKPEQRIDDAIAELNEVYDSTGRSFRIERVAGGFRVMTRPEFGTTIAAMSRSRSGSKLSQAALETLAIVAYRQPIIRADIESIRGVACGEVLRGLMERRLVKIVGRAEELGRPMLYGTTREFLEVFGLASLKDLPSAKELRAP